MFNVDTISYCKYWFGKDNGHSCCYNETRKALTGKANKDEELFYKDVIRTEVKVKNGKLNSNKSQDTNNNKGKIRTKDLEYYYNYEALGLYYTKTIKKYLLQNHFTD